MNSSRKRTYLKVFLNLGISLCILLVCVFLLPRIIIWFMPFVTGWIIALIASPLVHFFEKRLKIRRKAGTAFVIISVIALVILAGYLIGAQLVEQIAEFIGDVPKLWEAAQEDFAQIGEKLSVALKYLPSELQLTINSITGNVQEYFGGIMESISEPTITALGNFVGSLPNIVISVIMSLLFAYFYVSDKGYLSGLLEKAIPDSVLVRLQMIKRGLTKAVGGYFKAQLKIEVWMYLLLGIGFSILQVKYAFLIAIGVAILDLLPFFGTGTVLIPWAIIKFLSADYKMVIGLLIIWGVGQLARQLIQPKIVGDSVGLAPIPTIILLFVGYRVAGVIGMIIAVPIGIIILNLYEEGVFDTTINSLKILYAGISNFRHLTKEDMEEVEHYRKRQETVKIEKEDE
ncbi:MAG: sporulation integral membrane protein YtvI [Lachnospiraceae bacterium]|nr:sporulation integral membrane protein YtvI [Lachnospiraceae bacterium]MDD7628812.1 sporulation integral membrane protein YtvI [Lachnospiraceae bacterium]MDY4120306.1 sporulation integral membrane protein YtvI [Lachnospiraceae bacterium]